MTELKTGTWVVIADGEKALFLENTMDAEDPYLVVRRIDVRAWCKRTSTRNTGDANIYRGALAMLR